jgi:hypothetical protein
VLRPGPRLPHPPFPPRASCNGRGQQLIGCDQGVPDQHAPTGNGVAKHHGLEVNFATNANASRLFINNHDWAAAKTSSNFLSNANTKVFSDIRHAFACEGMA